MENNIKKRGFGSMSPERRREISRMGGKVTPNNFKNNPEFAKAMGRKSVAMRQKKRNDTGK